jgi:hypothetical protein
MSETALFCRFGPTCCFARGDIVHKIFNIFARDSRDLMLSEQWFDMTLYPAPVSN